MQATCKMDSYLAYEFLQTYKLYADTLQRAVCLLIVINCKLLIMFEMFLANVAEMQVTNKLVAVQDFPAFNYNRKLLVQNENILSIATMIHHKQALKNSFGPLLLINLAHSLDCDESYVVMQQHNFFELLFLN